MSTAPTASIDWRQEWFEIEDATFLNVATQGPMPKTSLRAIQNALEWKKFPHRIPDTSYFDIPNRVRDLIAKIIHAKPEEVALTTGASAGAMAVAYNLPWKSGDEILTAKGEFPLQYTTWKPLEEREGVSVRIIEPTDRYISADDFIAAMTPRTRLISASLVRFDNGVRLEAERLAAACHKQGALLLLDVSQCCGAMPLDVSRLGADFLICAGYKWLLGPYGTGFFWTRKEQAAAMRPGPFYWMAMEGADKLSALSIDNPKPVAGSRRWDTPETANYFNLAGLEASLAFVLEAGVETVEAHNHKLIELLYERLPKDRCIPASPLQRERRGPYGCFTARTAEKTRALYRRLEDENVIVGLREGRIRISPHLFNTERDIDRVVAVVNG